MTIWLLGYQSYFRFLTGHVVNACSVFVFFRDAFLALVV